MKGYMFRLKHLAKSLYSLVLCCIFIFLGISTLLFKTVSSPRQSCTENTCNYRDYRNSVAANFSEEISAQQTNELEFFENGDNPLNDFFEFPCKSVKLLKTKTQNRRYIIYKNAVTATRTVKCYESITYVTHGDFRYLDNLEVIVERWNGPVSIAIYCPGSDLEKSIERIHFLRECSNSKIMDWVTIHLFMDIKYLTKENNITLSELENEETTFQNYNCSNKPEFGNHLETFRTNRMLYPVNIARNLARKGATTHFLLCSDIELFPSANFIISFFKMLSQNKTLTENFSKIVFVLPVFEINYGNDIPEYKEDLIDLIHNKVVVPFHAYICPYCHRLPRYNAWVEDEVKFSMGIFDVFKRLRPFHQWEPIFVGTNDEPFYDERLSWEGLRDKMTQAYEMCLLDYDFAILDNAFLIHREGIKSNPHNMSSPIIKMQERLISLAIKTQLISKYGDNKDCFLLQQIK